MGVISRSGGEKLLVCDPGAGVLAEKAARLTIIRKIAGQMRRRMDHYPVRGGAISLAALLGGTSKASRSAHKPFINSYLHDVSQELVGAPVKQFAQLRDFAVQLFLLTLRWLSIRHPRRRVKSVISGGQLKRTGIFTVPMPALV
jgi:hypothetical protein